MNKLNIDTSVSKMGLTTASAQLASIIRAKLWKVVIVSRNNMFSNFWALFLKMYTFEVVTFFSRLSCLSNQLTFSVVVRIYKIHLFGGAFVVPLSNHSFDNWKKEFFLFSWQPLLGKQIYSWQSNSLSTQINLTPKNWSQTDRDYLKNCCQGVPSTLKLRT